MPFWRMTICSQTLYWSDISLTCCLVIELGFTTKFDFLSDCERFTQNFSDGCGISKEDTDASGHLVLSHFRTCMCFNVETSPTKLVSSPDFMFRKSLGTLLIMAWPVNEERLTFLCQIDILFIRCCVQPAIILLSWQMTFLLLLRFHF